MSWQVRAALSALALCAAPVLAQVAADGPAPVSGAATRPQDATTGGLPAIPALLTVSVEILADLGSKISKSGDRFPLRLAAPIMVDGVEVVPAGAKGEGEVVHAKKSGGMGAAGELVLAARFVEHSGRRIALRSLRIVPQGRSAINTVNAINVGSVASPLPVGLIGFFISGGQAVVPAGTIAEAKVAQTVPASLVPALAKPDAAPAETPAAHLPENNQEPKEGEMP